MFCTASTVIQLGSILLWWRTFPLNNIIPLSSVLCENACGQYKSGRALFCEFPSCNRIFISGNKMLDYIGASGDTSQIHGYLIHSSWFMDCDATSTFWQLQSTIFAQLCLLRDLQVVVAIVHPNHYGRSIKSFITSLKPKGWKISQTDVSFPEKGNTIAGTCQIICRNLPRNVSYKRTFGTPDQGQTLDVWDWHPADVNSEVADALRRAKS